MSVRSYKTESDRERERARETPSPASVSPPPISGSPGLVQTPNSAPPSSQIPHLHFHQKVAVWLIPHNVGDLELSGGSPASRSASGGFGGGEVWVYVGGGFGAVPGDFLENAAFWPCFSCKFHKAITKYWFLMALVQFSENLRAIVTCVWLKRQFLVIVGNRCLLKIACQKRHMNWGLDFENIYQCCHWVWEAIRKSSSIFVFGNVIIA